MTEDASNADTFQNCLADILIAELAPAPDRARGRRRKQATTKCRQYAKQSGGSSAPTKFPDEDPEQKDDNQDEDSNAAPTSDVDDLSDFVEYLSQELFHSLPADLQSLNYTAIRNDENLSAAYSTPLPLSTLETLTDHFPASTRDSLQAYNLLPPDDHLALRNFLRNLLTAYVAAVTSPPSNLPLPNSSSRPTACEICGRDWIPLTYHHLIPRGVHAKVLKRGWHEEWRLNSVAWICRACHSMVHRVASNEELAKEFWSVELLLQREDVRAFAAWVGGVRWKKR